MLCKLLKFNVLLILILFWYSEIKSQVNFQSSNLPIIKINTNGQEIRNSSRIVVDMKIIDNGPGNRNSINDNANNYSGKINIEIRGQSSSGWLKKQYAFETQKTDGTNLNVSLLGLPEENDWILYAPYYDRSFLRNVLVYRIARQMGRYASRTKYCELMLNNQYQGIYVLMEKIKVDKNRVDIAKLNPDEITGDDLTGGYIVRIDKMDGWPRPVGFYSQHKPFPGSYFSIFYQYRYPKDDVIVNEQKEYVKNYIYRFEDIMASDGYNDPDTGYVKYIDEDSFIDYFILNELSKNVDGYRLSAYFYKDKDSNGGKLYAGPVWDFNFSFGNIAYYGAQYFTMWNLDALKKWGTNDRYLVPFWWYKLLKNEIFMKKVYTRWHEIRASILDISGIHDYIDAVADTLNEAKDRNFQIWIGPGDPKARYDGWFPPDSPIRGFETYQDEIDYLKTWLSGRILWIENELNKYSSSSVMNKNPIPNKISLKQNYPNPFNSTTQIEYTLSKPEIVSLSLYDINGRFLKTLFREFKTARTHYQKIDLRSFATGIYFYKIETESGGAIYRKMLFLK